MSVRKARGFTIFEIMITVAIVALISAFAVPAFQDLMSRTRVNSVAEEVSNSLQLARNSAISRRRSVFLVPDTGVTYPKWEVHLDSTAGERIDSHEIPGNVEILWSAAVDSIEFKSSGYVVTDPATAPASLVMSVCDRLSKKDIGRNIELSPVGRMRAYANASTATCNP